MKNLSSGNSIYLSGLWGRYDEKGGSARRTRDVSEVCLVRFVEIAW